MKAENHELFVPQTLFDSRGEKEIEIECTLADYLPNISRILRVDAELLKDGHYKVGEIAVMVGYSASSYFSIMFKKHTGYSPREYSQRVSL